MKHPYDVKLTPDEVYVLSGGYILVLTYTGNMIRSFDTQSGYLGRIWVLPDYFCLDAHHNIIHGDWSTNNISILTKERTFLHSIQRPLGSIYLRGIALTNNLKIVTVHSDAPNQLVIYSS